MSEGLRSSANAVAGIYAAIVLGLSALIVTAPLPVLLDRFVPDDAFYYFTTARQFASTGFSSFDGLHFTNGYQPLWFLVSTVVFLIAPEGAEGALRALLTIEVIAGAVGVAILARAITRTAGSTATLITGVVWVLICQRTQVNGLETGLQTLCFAAALAAFMSYLSAAEAAAAEARRAARRLGVIVGVLFLARTDAVFLIVALSAFFLLHRRDHHAGQWRRFLLPVLAIAVPYLLINVASTGHLMPVSGAARMFHSEAARAHALAAAPATSVYVSNLLWPFSLPATWAMASLLTPPAAMFVAAFSRRLPAARRVLQMWPFAAGVWAAFLFYGLAFFGEASRTGWYFGPLVMVGWFYAASLCSIVASTSVAGRAPALLPFLWMAVAIGWISAAIALATAAAAIAIASAAPRIPSRWSNVLIAGLVLCGSAIVAWGVLDRGIDLAVWLYVAPAACALAAIPAASRPPAQTIAIVLLGIVMPTVLVHARNVVSDRAQPATGWNAHLLAGARWASEALPADATIWSGSAGILGYFSGRTVVNTDGLANDHAFLEQVLRPGRLPVYVAQWDYLIDALPDGSLQRPRESGCAVPLPAAIVPPPFTASDGRRQLGVIQMKPRGVVQCRGQ